MKRATAKKRQFVRRPRNRTERPRLSLENPPTGFTMSVEELAELINSGRNQAYEAVRQGVYPSIRVGEKGAFKVLVEPTLAILRGERPPGTQAPTTDAAIPIGRERDERRAQP